MLSEHAVQSTSQLTELILTLRGEQQGAPLWFRGHYSEEWILTSSLARAVSSPEEMFLAEQRLLTRFRQRSLPYWPQGYPQDEWEHLFAMQHHGVPTRLLDWSENLFVALYFACNPGPYSQISPAEEVSAPVLWAFDPSAWNRSLGHLRDNADSVSVLTTADREEIRPYAPNGTGGLPKRYNAPVAIYGTHNSGRIVAQRGGFTIAGKSLEPLNNFVSKDDNPAIWKIRLEYDRLQMRSDLAALVFAESMVFPDLVGLAREISRSEGFNG